MEDHNTQIEEIWRVYYTMFHLVSKLRCNRYGCPNELQFRDGSVKNDSYLYYFPGDMESAIAEIERVVKSKKANHARAIWKTEERDGIKGVTLIIITE